jgi:arylsulfatase A
MNRATALAVCAFLAGTTAAVAAPTPPNIVFIIADDMGFGDPGCYNPQSKIPTPHMDKLAADGLRFTDAHTPAAVCTPTRYGALTGRYCWRRKKSGVLGGYSPPLIENTRPTIASLLKKQGYSTACIGKWHIGANFQNSAGKRSTNEKDIDFTAAVSGGPNALGFDYAYWHAGCGTTAPPYGFIENEHFVSKSFSYQKMPHGDGGMVEAGWVTANADPILTDKACEFIKKSASADNPFFLYLAPNAPHEPCVESVVPEFARGKSKAGSRGDLVWLFDWIVGRVVETLESTGQADNTMIIITSDNGALPGDFLHDDKGRKRRDMFDKFSHKSCGDFRGYKAHIWEGGHRVPLIVRWPGKVKASTVSDEVICLTDFVATSAAIVGAELPDDAAEDSVNMLPALLGQGSPDKPLREAIVHHSSDGVFAIRQGKWKLILESQGSGGWPPPRGGAPVPGTPGQLYDIEADPGEQTNLWDKHKDVVAGLTTLLKRFQDEGRSVPARQ